MSFDDIPEYFAPAYQCECGGTITLDSESGYWVCDTCDFEEDDD